MRGPPGIRIQGGIGPPGNKARCVPGVYTVIRQLCHVQGLPGAVGPKGSKGTRGGAGPPGDSVSARHGYDSYLQH